MTANNTCREGCGVGCPCGWTQENEEELEARYWAACEAAQTPVAWGLE